MTSVDRLTGSIPGTRLVPVAERSNSRSWRVHYQRRLAVTDALVIIAAVALAHTVRFGGDGDLIGAVGTPYAFFDYTVVSVVLAGAWIAGLAIHRTRSLRITGSGAEEYRRIVSVTTRLFGLVAITALLLRLDVARGYLAIALPVGLLGLVVSRRLWRGWLRARQRSGELVTTVLVIGSRAAASEMTAAFEREKASGYRVVGVCVPGALGSGHGVLDVGTRSVPILGDEHAVVAALAATGADVVAVTATEHLGGRGIRRLVWDIEPLDVDLVVSPGVADAAVPRLTLHPVADQPMLHVERPTYHGATRFIKTSFDLVFATLALLAVAPVLLAVAIAIKVDSRGPVLYLSERMGLNGKSFRMIKFRTMVVGADSHVAGLISQNDSEGGVLFKMREDPRVTRVGRILRKYSLDEIPQFVNVLRGEMSVVGPRPPLRREVETYDGDVRRRLLVRPGVTGLWQVSGRSDLSWDDAVRLDLSYVENWSMTQDMVIIAKTVGAVLRSDGAY